MDAYGRTKEPIISTLIGYTIGYTIGLLIGYTIRKIFGIGYEPIAEHPG